MPSDILPLVREDAVHHRVARAAILARAVVAKHAVLLRAQSFDRALRPEVEPVGAKADDLAAERVERVLEQQELARGVDVRALIRLRVPRVADFDAIDAGDD